MLLRRPSNALNAFVERRVDILRGNAEKLTVILIQLFFSTKILNSNFLLFISTLTFLLK